MTDHDVLKAMREDIAADRKIIQVKAKIVRVLGQLPDDAARRRVIAATAILLGMKEP